MLVLKTMREARKLAFRLAASIVDNEDWVIRADSSAHTTLEYIDADGKTIYSASIIPGCCRRLCWCDKVRLTVDGGVCWLGPLATLRLRNAIRYFVARRGNELAAALHM